MGPLKIQISCYSPNDARYRWPKHDVYSLGCSRYNMQEIKKYMNLYCSLILIIALIAYDSMMKWFDTWIMNYYERSWIIFFFSESSFFPIWYFYWSFGISIECTPIKLISLSRPTLSLLCASMKKRKKIHLIQFVLPKHSLKHSQIVSDQPLKDNWDGPHTPHPSRSHQLWTATVQHPYHNF